MPPDNDMTNANTFRPSNDNEMTLADAHNWLASIGYRDHWTVPELIEATAHLSRDDRANISAALRVTATAAALEADRLEGER